MKKSLIALALVAGTFSTAAFADDGKINFNGSITDTACTVVNHMGNPLAVTMGTVSSKAFQGAGSTASPTKFSIVLKDCPRYATSAKVKFDGTADRHDNSILALTRQSHSAHGVGIQIMDKQNVVVPLHTASSAYQLRPGNNTLDFVARYYATANLVTAGTANATTNFTLNYN